MKMKTCKEWTVDTVWGKVAMVSWGEPTNHPVLLLHGYLDTAATFIPLVRQLPDTYYYVAFDNPAIFYHAVYPNRITSMVNVDSLPAITNYYAIQDMPEFWYDYFYNSYYDSYKWNYEGAPLQTREQALQQLMVNRNLSREQAEVVSSRGLEHVRGDMYRFTRQNMVRKLTQFPVFNDTLRSAILTNPPRMLNLIAIQRTDRLGRDFSSGVMEELDKDDRHSTFLVDGAHDVHITNPELLVDYIVKFLEKDELNKVSSKL